MVVCRQSREQREAKTIVLRRMRREKEGRRERDRERERERCGHRSTPIVHVTIKCNHTEKWKKERMG